MLQRVIKNDILSKLQINTIIENKLLKYLTVFFEDDFMIQK